MARTEKGLPARQALCPIRYALDIVGGKWKLAIICLLLSSETKRYGELKKKLSPITNMMLAHSLKEMEADGIVKRRQYSTIPPKVEYSLTTEGKSLHEALQQFSQWGVDHMKRHRKGPSLCGDCYDGGSH